HSSAPLVPCLHLVPPFLLRSARLPLFFLNAPAPTEIYTLSLHDALPISHTRHAYLNADGGYVTDTTATDGQNILAGNWPRINALVAHLFADPPLRSAHASVQVRNGQHTPGLAALYTTILQAAGFTTAAPRNADRA